MIDRLCWMWWTRVCLAPSPSDTLLDSAPIQDEVTGHAPPPTDHTRALSTRGSLSLCPSADDALMRWCVSEGVPHSGHATVTPAILMDAAHAFAISVGVYSSLLSPGVLE
jgi:hypothetical protein